METEKFCGSGVAYNHDSEGENSEDGTSEHIYFSTNKDNHFDRITRTGRWKITYSNSSSDEKELERMYNEYLDFLGSKYPDKKEPIYYHNN